MSVRPRALFSNRTSFEAYRKRVSNRASELVKALYEEEKEPTFETMVGELRMRFGLLPLVIKDIEFFQVAPAETTTWDAAARRPLVGFEAQARVLKAGSSWFLGKRPSGIRSAPFKAIIGASALRLYGRVESHDLRDFSQAITRVVDEMRRAYADYHPEMVNMARSMDQTLKMAHQYHTFGPVNWPPLKID